MFEHGVEYNQQFAHGRDQRHLFRLTSCQQPLVVKGGEKMYRVGGSTGVFGLSTFSVTVRANWPAKMSHSPHGECDIDAKRTDESPSFEQPASGADSVGSGGRVDGCQHTPRPPHHDRLPGGRSSGPGTWPPGPQTGQRHARGGDRRRGASGPALDTKESTIPI